MLQNRINNFVSHKFTLETMLYKVKYGSMPWRGTRNNPTDHGQEGQVSVTDSGPELEKIPIRTTVLFGRMNRREPMAKIFDLFKRKERVVDKIKTASHWICDSVPEQLENSLTANKAYKILDLKSDYYVMDDLGNYTLYYLSVPGRFIAKRWF